MPDWPWDSILNLAGTVYDSQQDRKTAQRQMDAQREFAQSGIQWKVADAKAAGVHPLFALGASTTAYSPVSVPPSHVGEALGRMGQGISRAMAAQTTEKSNELLDAQIAEARSRANLNDAQRMNLDSEVARRNQQMGLAIGGSIPGEVSVHPVSLPPNIHMRDLPSMGSGPHERAAKAGRAGSPNDPHGWNYDASKVGTAREFDPTVAAGPPRPFLEEYRIGSREYNPAEGEHGADRGLYIVLPAGGNASEAAEAIAEGGGTSPVAAMIYAINVQRYGLDYVRELGQMLRRSDERILRNTKEWGRRLLNEAPHVRNDPGIGRYR